MASSPPRVSRAPSALRRWFKQSWLSQLCLGEWLHHLRAGFKRVDHPTRTIRNRLSKATAKPHSGGRWSRPLLLQLEDRLMPGSIVVGISELIQCGERPNPYADFADSS